MKTQNSIVFRLYGMSLGLSGLQMSVLLYILSINDDWEGPLFFGKEEKEQFVTDYNKESGREIQIDSVYAAVAKLKKKGIIEPADFQSYYRLV